MPNVPNQQPLSVQQGQAFYCPFYGPANVDATGWTVRFDMQTQTNFNLQSGNSPAFFSAVSPQITASNVTYQGNTVTQFLVSVPRGSTGTPANGTLNWPTGNYVGQLTALTRTDGGPPDQPLALVSISVTPDARPSSS